MKQKRPDWLPSTVHISWYEAGIFTKEFIDESKAKLTKLGIHSFKPSPKEIFLDFGIDLNSIQFVVVNSTWPLCVRKKENGTYPEFKEYPKPLVDIWDKLQMEYQWEEAERYTYPDLSDWKNTLLLNTSLTNVREDIWEPLMLNIFKYFQESTDYIIFCFLDEKSFNKWSRYVKHKEVFYKFQPKEIQECMTKQWGTLFFWGLPF